MPKKVITSTQPISQSVPAQRTRRQIPEEQDPEPLDVLDGAVSELTVIQPVTRVRRSAAVYDRDRAPLPKPPKEERSTESPLYRLGFWIPMVLLGCLTVGAAVGLSTELPRKGGMGWTRLFRSSFRF